MENVKINKIELLTKIKENLTKHRAVFEEALEGYKKEVIKTLESRLEDARKGRRINLRIELVEPVDQTKEYQKVIKMLEMSVDNVIELSEYEFSCYVLDDWRWKDQFIASTSSYMNNNAE